MGYGATLTDYHAAIKAITEPVTGKLAVYNATLSLADAQLNDLLATEKALNAMGEIMLTGVGFKYGKDSGKYEKTGGVRTSERKAPVRKPKPTPAS